jgi:hypothetical protein
VAQRHSVGREWRRARERIELQFVVGGSVAWMYGRTDMSELETVTTCISTRTFRQSLFQTLSEKFVEGQREVLEISSIPTFFPTHQRCRNMHGNLESTLRLYPGELPALCSRPAFCRVRVLHSMSNEYSGSRPTDFEKSESLEQNLRGLL